MYITVKTKVEISHKNWCVHLIAYSTWILVGAAHQVNWEYLRQNVVIKNIQIRWKYTTNTVYNIHKIDVLAILMHK